MVSLRLLLVQESQRGYSPFSNTYCSPLHSGCSYPTHLRREAWLWFISRKNNIETQRPFPVSMNNSGVLSFSDPHSRSAQHQYGANFLHTRFLEVVAGSSQLLAMSLEVFLLIDNQLWGEKNGCKGWEAVGRKLKLKFPSHLECTGAWLLLLGCRVLVVRGHFLMDQQRWSWRRETR